MIEEDASRRTIALSVKAGKLTARTLAVVLAAAGRKIQQAHRAAQTPHGKQSVKKLMAHGAATSSIPLDGETRQFDRLARKWNVDYSFHKVGPEKYLLFFKAGQADAVTACFAEYSKAVLQKGKTRRAPIREQLKQATELVRQQPQRERTKEAAREER